MNDDKSLRERAEAAASAVLNEPLLASSKYKQEVMAGFRLGYLAGAQAEREELLKHAPELLPECPSYIAHPQAVWFETHWRPLFDQCKARDKQNLEIKKLFFGRLKDCQLERDEARAELAALRAEIELRKQTERMLADEIEAAIAEVERLAPLAHVTDESSYKANLKRLTDERDRLNRELNLIAHQRDVHERRANKYLDEAVAKRAEVERMKAPVDIDITKTKADLLASADRLEIPEWKLDKIFHKWLDQHLAWHHAELTAERERAAKLVETLELIADRHPSCECMDAPGLARNALAAHKGESK